jgi:hypothetical protein
LEAATRQFDLDVGQVDPRDVLDIACVSVQEGAGTARHIEQDVITVEFEALCRGAVEQAVKHRHRHRNDPTTPTVRNRRLREEPTFEVDHPGHDRSPHHDPGDSDS